MPNRATRKIILLFAVSCLLLSCIGCESFRRKFIRKKDREFSEEVISIPQDYPALPPEEAYGNHYVYCRSWLDELIERVDDGNAKKLEVCLNQALHQMYQMKRYLVPAKQEELQPYIDDLERMVPKIMRLDMEVEINYARRKFEIIRLATEQKFRPSKVKECLQQSKQ